MYLKNPFPLSVRLLYLDCWQCWFCGSNGSTKGGLELHHIMGRNSACAFNSSVLCKECHSHIGHSREEEQKLFAKTLHYLYDIQYIPKVGDYAFMKLNYQRLMTPELQQWLQTN